MTSVDIVVPALDEEKYLVDCVERLVKLTTSWPETIRIVIVDSGSADSTWRIAQSLEEQFDSVSAMHLATTGRGRALRAAWSRSDADVVAYTDVDLSGDPEHLRPMIQKIFDGEADVVIGSRLARGAVVDRSVRRELLSRGYSELLAWVADPPFRDPQCGLKALRRCICREVLDDVVDNDWFFDTELLMNCWQRGATIAELPIRWVERRETRVRLPSTISEDLLGLVRLSIEQRSRHSDSTTKPAPAGRRRPVLTALATVGGVSCGVALRYRMRTSRAVQVVALAAGAIHVLGRQSRGRWASASRRPNQAVARK